MIFLTRQPTVTVWPPRPLPGGRIGQCLTLALLVHLLLVAMIGSTPGGSARLGEGVWGSFSVTLTGPPPSPLDRKPAPSNEPPAPPVDSGPVGQAPRQRFGGAVRPQPAPRAEPLPRIDPAGAAELGRWNTAPSEQLNGPATESPAPVPQPPEAATPVARLQTQTETAVERLQRPPPAIAPLAPAARTQADLLKPLPAAAPVIAPAPAPAPVQTPAAATPPEAAPAAELPPQPTLRQLPEPVPLTRRAPAELPLAVPSAKAVPEPLALPKALPEIVQQAPAAQPAPDPVPKTDAARSDAAQTPTPTPSAAASPRAAAAAPPSLAPMLLPPAGAPDAGTRLGHDIATPPSASASAPRRPLDLRMPVNGPIARQGSNSLLELMPHPPDPKTKLGENMEQAARKDCTKAYGDVVGILAVIPLAVDTVRDKGCKW